MKMLVIFHPRKNRWKDLIVEKKTAYIFLGALENENISGIAVLLLTKIPEYLIVFEARNLIE